MQQKLYEQNFSYVETLQATASESISHDLQSAKIFFKLKANCAKPSKLY